MPVPSFSAYSLARKTAIKRPPQPRGYLTRVSYSRTYAPHPTTALPPNNPSINALSIPFSSLTKTANTSIGGSSPNPWALFHRLILGIPTQGPYCEERSKWRRIFSWSESSFWCTRNRDTSTTTNSKDQGLKGKGILCQERQVTGEEAG